jgi:hypothetical protein
MINREHLRKDMKLILHYEYAAPVNDNEWKKNLLYSNPPNGLCYLLVTLLWIYFDLLLLKSSLTRLCTAKKNTYSDLDS